MFKTTPEFHIYVPAPLVGGLIGYNGKTIEALKKDTGCDVIISAKKKVKHRKVTFSGNVEDGLKRIFEQFASQVEKAEYSMKSVGSPQKTSWRRESWTDEFSSESSEMIADWSDVASEKEVLFNVNKVKVFKVGVTPNQVSAIIGKGGERVENLRKSFKCSIRIQQNGEIDVIGQLEPVSRVLNCIWKSIENIPRNQPSLTPQFQHLPMHGSDVDVVIMMPTESIGPLIGKNGTQITQIRRNCVGVKIIIENGERSAVGHNFADVPEFSMHRTMRMVTLKGNLGKIMSCLQILGTYM